METSERIHPLGEPRATVRRAGTPTATAHEPTLAPSPAASAALADAPIRRGFQARLNYDPFDAEVFIEIIDPETGDVIRRFPAESLEEDSPLPGTGNLIDKFA